MLQVRKSRFCQISAIFFPVLLNEWNTSINGNFWFLGFFFLGMISWKRALLFNREGLVSNEGGGFIFRLSGWGWGGGTPLESLTLMEGRGFQKNSWEWGVVPPMPPSHHGIPWIIETINSFYYSIYLKGNQLK